jgi:hypothetical protein
MPTNQKIDIHRQLILAEFASPLGLCHDRTPGRVGTTAACPSRCGRGRTRPGRVPRSQRIHPPGSKNATRTQGLPRNLGWSLAALREQNGTTRRFPSRPDGERSECAVVARKQGNSSGGPCRAKERTEEQIVGGKDERVTELTNHLNQARTNSESSEGTTRHQHENAGALHRRGLDA